MKTWLAPLFLALGAACGRSPSVAPVQQSHSSTIAIHPDGARLFVVHPDADSVSILDPTSRGVVSTVLLGASPPAVDPVTNRYDPGVQPRALALDSTGAHLYVTGQRSGKLYVLDAARGTVTGSVTVCSEPIGVVVSADDLHVFVACSQDDLIAEVDPVKLAVTTTVPCARRPWGLAWAADRKTLIATHLLGPGLSTFTSAPLGASDTWPLADGPAGSAPTAPHGPVRGIYDAVVRPGTAELWVAHVMLGIDTPQPALDFQNTVFPALSLFDGSGNALARLSVQVTPGDGGAFGDVVSGPRAITFSTDGKLAFVVDADSEDVLVVDAERRVEATVLRPLPGHLPEGAVWGADGELYVQERNTEDVVAFKVTTGDAGPSIVMDGPPIPSLATDPMPAHLRLGQKLFYSANSDDVPVTQDHWAACASCHIEGHSDAVTWLFAEGPRDTPSNAGGVLETGFLLRTAVRQVVQDYWQTINAEQGGDFHLSQPEQRPLLDALADYVNLAIPLPIPPTTDPAKVARGEALFHQVGCTICHGGVAYTDSGKGNATLDLAGPIMLHDVGTCVTTGPFPDVTHTDEDGHPRAACAFDTPTLRGIAETAPYMHDGSAATLDDAVKVMLKTVANLNQGYPSSLSASQEADLVEFLRSL